ncbi:MULTISPECIES: hydrogenase large subunit [Methanosarcina]|uniref:Energy-conserving hydrogenase (Ferredoxin), subunit E n=3 Tax=Methanosarcina barkeri TaxID=2208 RepID=A0A0E3QWE3_METBA|nr:MULTISPECIES: nickel-dependent hydrogenase large subunit [Methanosarcina]AKB55808.1 Energy-conserving hydrogenase (ferredoxin), subunit E [Methanosarcina barkeri MS]AKB59283.1 Energy-conserving hydrogenase (ferredoxin), subunit E [Methanosarcina barkeri 227]AKJ39944.1 Ech hydrogenase subunit E EchE [Methanosarcina barkeri CM1]OEC90915.1 NADH dehydrogenase [Methanosarcina sp. A14]
MTTIIPFGPQHPVLPEPVSLKLEIDNDVVVGVLPSLGYVHRGLETFINTKDFNQTTYVCERICGICSALHGITYTRAVEKLFDTEIPERAQYIRVIVGELNRLHSHLLWLGLFADGFGFESLFYECWKYREEVLDVAERICGNRVIHSISKVGGVTKDLTKEHIDMLLKMCDSLEPEIKNVEKVFVNNYTVKQRLVGLATMSKQVAYEAGTAGPTLRGSGNAIDVRETADWDIYKDLGFKTAVEKDGDCYARTKVRITELLNSLTIIRNAISKMPDGEIETRIKGFPTGEAIMRTEQPRGEVVYYVKGNGTKKLERLKVRTPTFANIPSLLLMLPGVKLADVPIVVLTIDPCVSCTER